MNYDLMSYCTIYKCSGDVETKFKEDICFSKAFGQMDSVKKYNCEYTIRVYKGEIKAKCYKDNNCFLTKEELNYFINSIKRICKFSFTIDENEEYLDVIVKINDKKVMHKFVLTWIRYCYEHPANFCVKYAFRLKNEFKKKSFFNLVNLIESTLNNGVRNCHSLTDKSERNYVVGFKLSDIKKHFTSYKGDVLFDAIKYVTTTEKLGTLTQKNLEDWEGLYKSGVLIKEMRNNYKIFKKLAK